MEGVASPTRVGHRRLTLLLEAVEMGAEAVQLLDGFGSIEVHQFDAMPHLDPADAALRDEETDGVAVLQVNNQRCTFGAVTAQIAGGQHTCAPKALGKGLEAQHQVRHHIAVLGSQSEEHEDLDIAAILRISSVSGRRPRCGSPFCGELGTDWAVSRQPESTIQNWAR